MQTIFVTLRNLIYDTELCKSTFVKEFCMFFPIASQDNNDDSTAKRVRRYKCWLKCLQYVKDMCVCVIAPQALFNKFSTCVSSISQLITSLCLFACLHKGLKVQVELYLHKTSSKSEMKMWGYFVDESSYLNVFEEDLRYDFIYTSSYRVWYKLISPVLYTKRIFVFQW